MEPLYKECRDRMIECLRHKDLVLAMHTICKGSFYTDLLEKHNGWQRIKFSEIDWHQDHVAGFLMEPLQRFFKGVTSDLQYVCYVHDISPEQFRDHIELGRSMMNFVSLFSHHSLPLWNQYEEYMYRIDWIPIDLHCANDEDIFSKLCAWKNIALDWSQRDSIDNTSRQRNTDNVTYQKWLKIVEDCWQNQYGEGNAAFYTAMRRDFELYNQVINGISHWNDSWPDVSWLTADRNSSTMSKVS